MKVVAISSTDEVKDLVADSQSHGYLTFIYHHADPEHELLNDKFLYVHSDEELKEKLHLLQLDAFARESIRK